MLRDFYLKDRLGRRLLADGGNVVVFDLNDEAGKKLEAEFKGQVLYCHVDVTNEESTQKGVDAGTIAQEPSFISAPRCSREAIRQFGRSHQLRRCCHPVPCKLLSCLRCPYRCMFIGRAPSEHSF